MSAHSQLQSQVIEYLNFLPYSFAYDTPTTGGRGKRKKSASPGKSDIVWCFHGRYIAIEIKIPPDGQRPDQEIFEENITNAMGEYWIVMSIAGLIKIISSFRKIHNL